MPLISVRARPAVGAASPHDDQAFEEALNSVLPLDQTRSRAPDETAAPAAREQWAQSAASRDGEDTSAPLEPASSGPGAMEQHTEAGHSDMWESPGNDMWGKLKARHRSETVMHSLQVDMRGMYGQHPDQVEKHEQDLLSAKSCLFHPNSNFHVAWDALQVVALLFTAIFVPLRIALEIELEPDTFQFWGDVLIDSVFVTDIFINFRTAYYEDAVVVTQPRRIACNYMHGWFAIDVVSCLPVSYLTLLVDKSDDSNVGVKQSFKGVKVLRLMRLAKLGRMHKLVPILKRIDEKFEGLDLATTTSIILSLIFAILIFSHWMGCVWIYVGRGQTRFSDNTTAVGWIQRQDFTPDVSPGTVYLFSFYWAITTLTTVGYGDITAKTHSEIAISIFAELAGTLCFSVVMGTVSAMVTRKEVLTEAHEKHMLALKEYLEAKRVPADLRKSVKHFMEDMFVANRGFDEHGVLAKLPPHLATALLDCTYKKELGAVSFFKGLHEGAFKSLCMIIKPLRIKRNEILYSEQDFAREAFLIIRGTVSVQRSTGLEDLHSDPSSECEIFGPGALVGGAHAISNFYQFMDHLATDSCEYIRYTAVAQASEDCMLAVLPFTELVLLTNKHPSLAEKLSRIATGRDSVGKHAHANGHADDGAALTARRTGGVPGQALPLGKRAQGQACSLQTLNEVEPLNTPSEHGKQASSSASSASGEHGAALGRTSSALNRKVTPADQVTSPCWPWRCNTHAPHTTPHHTDQASSFTSAHALASRRQRRQQHTRAKVPRLEHA